MDRLINQLKNVLIECEMPAERKQRFRLRYHTVAGELPNEDYMLTQNNKWGIEYRVYFDARDAVAEALREAGFHVEARMTGYRSDREFRINDDEFFWALIERGFHLGPN